MRTRMIAFALLSLMINGCYAFGIFNNVQIHNNDVEMKDVCYPVWEILASRKLMGCLLNYKDEKESEIEKQKKEIENQKKETEKKIEKKKGKRGCPYVAPCP
ncbi:uncharacterized protein [Antedon mediterranea]|uniref:uncharacterized protein n=1 Tax=Antedon mediterranea TaxID=105859 RepID=UPI003AF7EDBB